MKIIDEYVGRVIVFFISVFKKNKSDPSVGKINNILFIKFWGIGSIILTAPALNKIKSVYPESKIFFLTLKNNLEICNEIKTIDEVVNVDISNPVKFLPEIVKKIKSLREIDFDIVFDFEFYTYFSAIIVSLLEIKKSFGFDNLKNNRRALFTKTILFNDRIHTKDNFLNLVNADESNALEIQLNSFSNINVLPDNKNGELQIVINPNASRLAFERRLPGKNYIEIINHITSGFKCKVFLTGLKDEVKYVESIYRQLENKNRINNLCGKTSVKELIGLINSSNCLITNDSGPLHIASALNVPVIAFFGPESPARYGPLSDKNLIFYEDLECSPCMSISNSKTINCIYDSPKCMEQFEMNDVIRKIDLFINEILTAEESHSLQWSESM